jgi:signal transduction histidine kinase
MIEYSFSSKPYGVLETSGDFQIFISSVEFDIVVVGDVGGHDSKNIFEVAEKCKTIVGENVGENLSKIFHLIHNFKPLKKYGLSLLIAKIYKKTPIIEYIGVGNLKFILFRDENKILLKGQDGIVGYQIPPKIKTKIFKIRKDDLFFIFTDGISINEKRLKNEIDLSGDVRNISDEIVEKFGKDDDDSLCSVFKIISKCADTPNIYIPTEEIVRNFLPESPVKKAIFVEIQKNQATEKFEFKKREKFKTLSNPDMEINIVETGRLKENLALLFNNLPIERNLGKKITYVLLEIFSNQKVIHFSMSKHILQIKAPIQLEQYNKISDIFQNLFLQNKTDDIAVFKFQFYEPFNYIEFEKKGIPKAIENDVDLDTFQNILKEQQKEKLLQQQSKLAMMGEMIGAIAHQWRQPLSIISGVLLNIEDSFFENELDEEVLQEELETAENSLTYMSRTIDDFRNFFAPSKNKKDFYLEDSIINSVAIVFAQLKIHNISISLKSGDETISDFHKKNLNGNQNKIFGYPSEFTQVILNLVSNAKDAIIENGISNGLIAISVERKGDEVSILVRDNGGGIPEKVLERVFEPYFTTKEEGKGTGIGLYMSKMIIEDNMGGVLSAKSIDGATIFTITFNIE